MSYPNSPVESCGHVWFRDDAPGQHTCRELRGHEGNHFCVVDRTPHSRTADHLTCSECPDADVDAKPNPKTLDDVERGRGVNVRSDLGEPRLFWLQRDVDETGTSGEGRVADGVQWPDGSVAIRWRTRQASHAQYESLMDLCDIHGHGGKTNVVWADGAPFTAADRLTVPCTMHD